MFNNQRKKAISLNLESDEGHQIAVQLIEGADVLLENYPGTMAKYGFSPEQALTINPLLIYYEMTGFGRDNPFAGRPAYDPVIQNENIIEAQYYAVTDPSRSRSSSRPLSQSGSISGTEESNSLVYSG